MTGPVGRVAKNEYVDSFRAPLFHLFCGTTHKKDPWGMAYSLLNAISSVF